MKTKLMTLATLALALSPSLALASAPEKPAKSNGTYTHSSSVHDRTPVIHDRNSSVPR